MTTLQQVELGVLGPLQVRQYGLPVTIPGAKPRAILTMLGLHGGSVISADTLTELLWGADPPRTSDKALQTHISALRRALGDGFVLTEGAGWTVNATEIDATRYQLAAKLGRDAVTSGDSVQAVHHFDAALRLWRGIPELPDGPRAAAERTRWIESHSALVEDRADSLLAMGRAAEIIGELEAAIADAPLRERRWGQLMLALYRAGRQGEALGAYQRVRSLLADELGVDPGPELRRLEAAIVAQDEALDIPVAQNFSAVNRAVTFLLTDIEGSTAAWEADADAMAAALARHDEIIGQVVTSRAGRLIKTRGEGDATFSVFDRPSAAAAAAIELHEAMRQEPWAPADPIRIRMALHTGEVEFRDGDYFGRAVNRAARLRSLAAGGQILCSGATAELVIDTLADDVMLVDLGVRALKNLTRPEHVFELRLQATDEARSPVTDVPIQPPDLPAVLTGPGPFVGRGHELEQLLTGWRETLVAGAHAVLIAGEPGVGKTRLAGEWSRQAHDQGAVVLYGRCDEDLGAHYQPFAEALRALVPCLGADRLRGLRGVEALLRLVPGLADVLPDLAAPPRADPDTERYALFDAVVAVFGITSPVAPVILILDDLHWASKPTLLLLRHLLRFGEHLRVQIIGTYRSTDLDRSHPLAAMLADLHRDGSAVRLALGGLDEDDVTAYVAESGYNDHDLAHALASVTGGNPFFLIEALRHVDESGGRWDPNTLPQGVREAVSRRLSRLPAETNKALAAAAVVGSHFALDLVEQVVGTDLVDAFDAASQAGLVIEEPGGRYRFNHAIVRQSLLAELASVRRMRLHQRIAAVLETESGANDELLAELAYHYFECAWAGNARKAVDYCRRAADQAMTRLAYEGAADLYDKALHALDELDSELPDRNNIQAELLIARCEALLTAGEVTSAQGAVAQLRAAADNSARLAAWGTCFDGELSMLTEPERLDEIASAVGAATETLAGLKDAAGEAKGHTVRAYCLGRLGRVGDCETALDQALTAARRAGDHRRVNAVLAVAPLAALWGPNPVPRAGGRCLDVVRLLRITTGSPVVEATSTRCQAVLDAFRGRAAAGRQLIDSARRSLSELGMRHALLEVDQFAGIIELVADDPGAAEPHLRQAYDGFRRMGLDADTAETAALLARACLALGRDDQADELCSESERLAGHALKAAIAWRAVRAQLLARRGDHAKARRVAEDAVALAERTDALVDHGDACLALATVFDAAGDSVNAQTAAERAVGLYELKGAAALEEKARRMLGERDVSPAPVGPEPQPDELDNTCVGAIRRLQAAVDREAWAEVEQLLAPVSSVESRRKILGFTRIVLQSHKWPAHMKRYLQSGMTRHHHEIVAVRGERFALVRMEIGTEDDSPGAPEVELLRLFGLDEEGRIALQVAFDVEDLDGALAELDAQFERQHRPGTPPENAASRAEHSLNALFARRHWDEIAARLVAGIQVEERRRGFRHESDERADLIAEVHVLADLGVKYITSTPVAVRGERLVLSLTRFSGRTQRPDTFQTEVLRLAEIDDDQRFVAFITFDTDDIDTAITELDARYLAGEAAPYAQTWSVFSNVNEALNRGELFPTTPDWVNIDHRRGAAFAPSDMTSYMHASWEQTPAMKIHVEAVHRLSELGAVVTSVSEGSSRDGFDAEWRTVAIATVAGDQISRCEMFDAGDLDAALARFDELSHPAPRLQNSASQLYELWKRDFAARDWDALTDLMADDVVLDDRRRVVNAGIRRGRDAALAETRSVAGSGTPSITSKVIATRGEYLALLDIRASGRDPEPFHTDALHILEVADERVTAYVAFDPDDLDSAFAELDARYLAGEAAPYAQTWSVGMRAIEAVNRRELPDFAGDFVSIDHRSTRSFPVGKMTSYVHATWNEVPDEKFYIEAVHRLSDCGAVVTYVAAGTSKQGFDAEWRGVTVSTVSGELFNHIEMYDESDLDAALARFDELARPAPRLENAATRADVMLDKLFADRRWDAMGALVADEFRAEDRRLGLRRTAIGRDAEVSEMQAIADLGVTAITATVLAIRGERLALSRSRFTGRDRRPDAFHTEILCVLEIDSHGHAVAVINFDPDDRDAAFDELDSRYAAGEAAVYAHTWSAVTAAYTATNHRELPAVPPDVIDHRRLSAVEGDDLIASLHAAWELTPDGWVYIETVHRLDRCGAVVTHVARGTGEQDFDAEWRSVNVLTVGRAALECCELFDEADLDAALVRFDELSQRVLRLENTASRMYGRFNRCLAARDWDTMAELLADNHYSDDRRRVVGAGVRHGRDAEIEDLQEVATALGEFRSTADVIATRGERLMLCRSHFVARDQQPDTSQWDLLGLVEIDNDRRISAFIVFDPGDIDAAFAELDARYGAGEAAAHTGTWSLVVQTYSAFNRRELLPTSPDRASIDHRRGIASAQLDAIGYAHAAWDSTPDTNARVEAVHRLTDLGALVTVHTYGTSREGFQAEWRDLHLLTFEDGLGKRFELFDEADLDAALTRFDELS